VHTLQHLTIIEAPNILINDILSKRKGAACPHCLEDTCVIWLRHSKKYIFIGHGRFLRKKHPYRSMDCQFNGEKENREAPLHVTGDLVHLKVKDIKTIEEYPN
jgi:hypothetical protein